MPEGGPLAEKSFRLVTQAPCWRHRSSNPAGNRSPTRMTHRPPGDPPPWRPARLARTAQRAASSVRRQSSTPARRGDDCRRARAETGQLRRGERSRIGPPPRSKRRVPSERISFAEQLSARQLGGQRQHLLGARGVRARWVCERKNAPCALKRQPAARTDGRGSSARNDEPFATMTSDANTCPGAGKHGLPGERAVGPARWPPGRASAPSRAASLPRFAGALAPPPRRQLTARRGKSGRARAARRAAGG